MLNPLRRAWQYLRDLAWTDEKAWNLSLWNLRGLQSLSGETVTESTALTYSAVFNAVSLISGTIGALPLHLMQRKGEKKRIADDRRTYSLMHDYWNPYVTAMSGRETMMGHVLLWGNGYAEKVFDIYGDVAELWPIAPDRMTVMLDNGRIFYEISMPRGQKVRLPRERILHIPGLGFDGLVGYSVVSMARKSIGLSMALETFGSKYFGEGTHPGVIVSHPGKLSQQASDNLRKTLTDGYSGLGKSHRLLLLEEGMKMEKMSIPPNDSQFLETRSFQVPEVARWFNLPPHKLKEMGRATWGNIESEQISFLTDSILPWLVRLEQNYNMQILTKSDKELSGYGKLYFKHSVEGLLRSDSTSRSNFYARMFNIGALSINEIRAFEELDPIPNGDTHFVPLNMVAVQNAGSPQLPEPKIRALFEFMRDAFPTFNQDGGGNGHDKSARSNLLADQGVWTLQGGGNKGDQGSEGQNL